VAALIGVKNTKAVRVAREDLGSVCSLEKRVEEVACYEAADSNRYRKDPDADHVRPEQPSRLNQVVLCNGGVVPLGFGEVVAGADVAWLAQSVVVRHEQHDGSVHQNQLVDPTDVVSVHQQAVDAVDCQELVSHGDEAEHALGQVVHRQVLKLVANIRHVVVVYNATVDIAYHLEGAVGVLSDIACLLSQ
jgi:hypothetical protein